MRRTLLILFVAAIGMGLVWLGCSNEPANITGPASELQPTAKPIGGPPGLARAMAAQEKHTSRLMALPDVVGTATGLGPEGRPAILVLTKTAGVRGIPRTLDGVPVIAKVTGEIRALRPGKGKKPGGGGKGLESTDRWPRPVPIGVSTGHPAITAGTIGCRVKDSAGNVYALSNNHVYADENLASIGDKVIQPGRYDGGALPDDEIGTLADFEPIVFSRSANNVIDAAIAATSTANLGNATPNDGYGTPKLATAEAKIDQWVMKYGRTTGQTKGKVYAINATVDVGYSSGTARFVDQIIITPGSVSAGGDSGSLVVVHDKKGKREGLEHRMPVGLLFAGSDLFTVANPIDDSVDLVIELA